MLTYFITIQNATLAIMEMELTVPHVLETRFKPSQGDAPNCDTECDPVKSQPNAEHYRLW